MRLTESKLNSIIKSVLNEDMYENEEMPQQGNLWELGELEQLAEENPEAQPYMPNEIAEEDPNPYVAGPEEDEEDPEMTLSESYDPWNAESIILHQSRKSLNETKRANQIIDEHVLLDFVRKSWNAPANRLLNK